MRATLAAEEVGIPAVGVVLTMFDQLSHFVASNYGRPDAKIVVWPGAIDDFSEAGIKEMTMSCTILILRVMEDVLMPIQSN